MTDEAMSPLRRRMIEDMTIRKLAPKTQHDYVQRVKNFAAFLGRSPDTASFEDVRRYQLHLAASGVGVPTINQTVSRKFIRRWSKSDIGSEAGIREPGRPVRFCEPKRVPGRIEITNVGTSYRALRARVPSQLRLPEALC